MNIQPNGVIGLEYMFVFVSGKESPGAESIAKQPDRSEPDEEHPYRPAIAASE